MTSHSIRNTVIVSALALWSTSPMHSQVPEKYTNLRVLPKDISRPQLVAIMRNAALGLGVRCEHCHVGEGDDLSKFDFASDAKAPKASARRMLAMVANLNDQWLATVGDAAPAGSPKVTCFTCHRGSLKPLTTPR